MTPFGPQIQAAVSIKEFGIKNILLWFLVDTGSTLTRLSEIDWKQKLALKPQDLVEMKDAPPIISVGGTFPQWKIPAPTNLIFRGVKNDFYIEKFPFMRVLRYPDNSSSEHREKHASAVPSIIGRDVITKFRMIMTHKKVTFEREDPIKRGIR